ncbi:MAG TPA: hypothetical protein VFS76_15360 [Pyrinomonadaceae bacterium]|nr:hypothetical protein [Pyrinomonadaceae bacterium]
MPPKFKIIEEYEDYTPPVRVSTAVELLMKHVPPEHVEGLRKVVLTNSARVLKTHKGKYTFDGKRMRAADLRGFYGNGHICLIMDRILDHYPQSFLLVPMIKTLAIGEILYHELGHHIHERAEPGFRDNREAVADEWSDELLISFFEKHYWFLAKILLAYKKLLHPVVVRIVRLFRRSS